MSSYQLVNNDNNAATLGAVQIDLEQAADHHKTYDSMDFAAEEQATAAAATNANSSNTIADDARSRASSNTSQNASRARSLTFSPSAPDNAPTVLTFTNINVTTRAKPKRVLLDNISGSITGGCWAIMGASGGGKTTLLSTLSLRLDPNYMEITGEFRLNGREYSRNVLKAMSAYVMQDDLLHAELTVYETLAYAAQLRMGGSDTASRSARIEEVINLMGIQQTRNVIIGNARKKGISGGERKRVSVAVELLNRPKLVFLDEPTSGLDSTTALSVCEALKNLTMIGECTIVCTIHQPQPKIFNLFDNIVLMKRGTIVYQGSINKLDKFLERIGHPLPNDLAMADHILEVIAPSVEDERIDEQGKKIVPVNLSLGIDKPFYTTDGARNWWDQFVILCKRNWHQYVRNSDIIFMNAVVTVLLAVFIGSGLWFQIGTGQDSIPKRVPSLFFTCITQGILGSLQSINSFPSERAIMLRERQAGTYQVSSYFAAKSLIDTITQMWPPILFTCIVYPLIGYRSSAEHFFIYMFFMILDCTAATSLATMITCICVSVEMSTVMLSLLFEICRLYGGFFASPAQMKEIPGWRFADILSYIKYAFVGIAINELDGLELDCDPGEKCTYTTGNQIMKVNGYDEYSIGFCIGILLVLIFGFRLLAYLGLRFIKV